MLVTIQTENTRLHIDFDKEEHYYEFNEDAYTYRELDAMVRVMSSIGIEEMDEDECPSEKIDGTDLVRVWCAEIPHQIPRHVSDGRLARGSANTEQG